MKIVAFHGSPGTPADFAGLKKNFSLGTLNAPARPGFKDLLPGDDLPGRQDDILVIGYSWGAVEALKFVATAASEGYRIRGIMLIAPYLFPKKDKRAKMKNRVIKLPIVGKKLLKKAGTKAIDEMLINSSAPCPVPESYLEDAKKYRDPLLLKRFVLEKSDPKLDVNSYITALRAKNISLGVVYGSGDLTSNVKDQIQPLKKILALEYEEVLPGGGHALLWTHVQQLTELIRKKYL